MSVDDALGMKFLWGTTFKILCLTQSGEGGLAQVWDC